ncbi:MAG: hypothetical protein Q8L48_28250 [Archangium sp.]|nr:hypothetical protein [Archangium sp.]
MNVLRSLARDLWNVVGAAKAPEAGAKTLDAVRQQRVPGVLGLSRFRDGFEQFPQGAAGTLRTLQAERAFLPAFKPASLQRDGFDGGARRMPVDLCGGVKTKYATGEASGAVAAPAGGGFNASLDDLASLL